MGRARTGLLLTLLACACCSGAEGELRPGDFTVHAAMVSFLDGDGASLDVARDGSFTGLAWQRSGECRGVLSDAELARVSDAAMAAAALSRGGVVDPLCDGISFSFAISVVDGDLAGHENAFDFDSCAEDDHLFQLGEALLAPLQHAAEDGLCSP